MAVAHAEARNPSLLPALAAPAGAAVILGRSPDAPLGPLAASPDSLFAPRGVLWLADGTLVVADTGHHRILLWRHPHRDGQPADVLWGQPDAAAEHPNRGGEAGPFGLRVPVGLAWDGERLFVADSFNHRILRFAGLPDGPSCRPDLVLGQSSFAASLPNRGGSPDGASLHWPFGLHVDGRGRLWVADAGNRRVLMWERPPDRPDRPADLVLGQRHARARDERAGRPLDGVGMRWPHAIWTDLERLFVADAGTSRIMIWDRMPRRDGAPCDRVLGQADATREGHNRGRAEPDAASLNMPYGLVGTDDGRLIVADTANSRLLAFASGSPTGAPAIALAGQTDASSRGDNRWGPATRDSLSWPYGLDLRRRRLAVADTGNDRVLLWDLAG